MHSSLNGINQFRCHKYTAYFRSIKNKKPAAQICEAGNKPPKNHFENFLMRSRDLNPEPEPAGTDLPN